MGKIEKTLLKILSGTSDSNIPFQDLCRVMAGLRFSCRFKGSTTSSSGMGWRRFSTFSQEAQKRRLIRSGRSGR